MLWMIDMTYLAPPHSGLDFISLFPRTLFCFVDALVVWGTAFKISVVQNEACGCSSTCGFQISPWRGVFCLFWQRALFRLAYDCRDWYLWSFKLWILLKIPIIFAQLRGTYLSSISIFLCDLLTTGRQLQTHPRCICEIKPHEPV